MLKPLLENFLKPMLSSITGLLRRWAYNFDGVDDLGQLQFRAINPDGDIDVEFKTGPTVNWGAVDRTVISQCLTATYGGSAGKEFTLYFNAVNGGLQGLLGGGYSTTAIDAQLQPNSHYRWQLIGTALKVWFNRVLVLDTVFGRGTSREPSAVTVIGAQTHGNASTFRGFSSGIFYDVRINGTLYPIAGRNQTIQLPQPSGLGPELITQSVLENPVVKGSQWTYLGDGRWRYVGDGTQNGLIFLGSAATPSDMLVEFEVESFSGTGNMRLTSVVTGTGDRLFNTTGLKRYYFTNDLVSNIQFERSVNGAACSCVIKNISFKPLWVANATELVSNGDFSDDTSGWFVTGGGSIAVTGGQCTLTTAASQNSRFERAVILEAGAYYICQCNVVSKGGAATLARLQITRGIAGNYALIQLADLTAASGKLSFVFLAPATDALVQVRGDGVNAGTITVDNISVRKLDSLCSPLTLVNTNPDRWVEIAP